MYAHALGLIPDNARVAGLAYGFCPYRIDQISHLQVIGLTFLIGCANTLLGIREARPKADVERTEAIHERD